MFPSFSATSHHNRGNPPLVTDSIFTHFEKTKELLIFQDNRGEKNEDSHFIGESEADPKLIIELAHKLGIKTKVLTEEDIEDLAMVYVIGKERRGICRYSRIC